MGSYILRRIVIAIPLLFLLSIISFMIMMLPPGSFVDTYIRNLEQQGLAADQSVIEGLKRRYGLDRPPATQYLLWMRNLVFHGEMGRSFTYNRPVTDVILERLPLTVIISLLALSVQWLVAIPIGIYSALRQHSIGDYIATFFGFIGLALPEFLFALVLSYVVFVYTGWAVTDLFSPAFREAPWSLARFVDLLKNIWLPVVVIATAGTAGLIRVLRATLLDEINKQYVTTARAKGLRERQLVTKYPVRSAINPLISTIGWSLPAIVGGEVIVSQVLGLETLGPALLSAALTEDMYLAGGILMILSSLTIIGTLLSDILLAWVDPRIRFNRAVA